MSDAGRAAARRAASRGRGGPHPAEAGAHLIVHDIKNLAGRLALLCQNLHERSEDPLFVRTALGVLDDTVSHLKRLAADVRDRDGRVMVRLRVEVNPILEGAVVDTRPDLAGDVRLVERYGKLPVMYGDEFLLRRAFACAIENALEAMRGRGTLSVRTAAWRRSGRRGIRVEIADTGPGMSPEFVRERLFRPFQSTKEDGLGLGLHSMAQVAQIHGGSVRILTREGEGTRVRFCFPCVD